VRDQFLSAVHARVNRFLRTVDPQAVLLQDVFLESAELFTAVAREDRGPDSAVCARSARRAA
jgi:hypothetical protein